MNPLGQLTWYTIHEMEVARPTIVAQLEAAGLDLAFAPPAIAPADAFRRATSAMDTKRQTEADGTFDNWLVREVRSDAQEIIRHLVREVVDAANRRLDYAQVARLQLDKATGLVEATALDGTALPEALQEQTSIAMNRYHRFCDVYQGRHLREVVLHLVKSLAPVAVRPSGGVYFIPAEHTETLARLQTFVQGVGAELWSVPMMDAGDARAVVAHSLDQEVEQAVLNAHRTVAAHPGPAGHADPLRRTPGGGGAAPAASLDGAVYRALGRPAPGSSGEFGGGPAASAPVVSGSGLSRRSADSFRSVFPHSPPFAITELFWFKRAGRRPTLTVATFGLYMRP